MVFKGCGDSVYRNEDYAHSGLVGELLEELLFDSESSDWGILGGVCNEDISGIRVEGGILNSIIIASIGGVADDPPRNLIFGVGLRGQVNIEVVDLANIIHEIIEMFCTFLGDLVSN